MLDAKFSMLLDDMKQYVNKSVEIRRKVADLKQNGIRIYSHEKIENDCEALMRQITNMAAEKETAAEKVITEIKNEMQNTSIALNLEELQPVFAYLQAAGGQASVNIIDNQIAKFAGNMDAVTALEEVAKNNNCSAGVLKTIDSYYMSADRVEEELISEVSKVYRAGASATDAGKHIVNIAKHCGANVTCNIVDEYNDNMLLRKAFGMNDEPQKKWNRFN